MKNKFKAPNPTTNKKMPKKWISKDLRYIPERPRSVMAESDTRARKRKKERRRRYDAIASSQKSDGKDSLSVRFVPNQISTKISQK